MKETDKEQYLKRGTLAVLGVMKDLLQLQTPLLVNFSRGQFISRMLAADETRIVFDLGSNNLDNDYALHCNEITVFAETHGAKIEFALGALEKPTLRGYLLFRPPCRTYCGKSSVGNFSASAPLWSRSSGAIASGLTARPRACAYRISTGGIGVLVEEAMPEGLKSGDDFNSLQVELGNLASSTSALSLCTLANAALSPIKMRRK